MRATELKSKIAAGALDAYGPLYADPKAQVQRYLDAIDAFTELYGDACDIRLFSVPGRSELSGNHTDHNHGRVLAGAIDRDIIAVAAKTEDGTVRIKSEGYPEDVVKLSDTEDPKKFKPYTSTALLAGICNAFRRDGYAVGGYCAYTTTQVLKGSGISSSAAFEVQCGNIMNYLYNDGIVKNEQIAKMAQYAENVYFGKPCGLMDQMACAVGGFLAIDFLDPASPVIDPIPFSLSGAGYKLCIVNTGGNHADLNEDYASVPAEMKAVASFFGREVLRGLSESDIISSAVPLRAAVGDRAILRALHFLHENERVEEQTKALKAKDFDKFLSLVIASGNSSFEYLQNVFTVKNVTEQGLSLALAITESVLADKGCAWRVHGGGFAGTIQAFVKQEYAEEYRAVMDSVFGEGAVMMLSVRPEGAVEIRV
jgi:galactokinase